MNDRDLRKKKHSQTSLRSTAQKHMHSSNLKVGPGCRPKQPPNISNHYLLQGHAKKELPNREIRIREQDTFTETDSRHLGYSRAPRTSNGKGGEDTLRKKGKDIPLVSKPHKVKQKLQNRENRQLRSNMDLSSSRPEKHTEKPAEDPMSLFCKERLQRKGKKSVRLQERESNSHAGLVASQKARKKTFAEEIAEFEASVQELEAENEAETLRQLFQKEQLYTRIENYNCYLVKNHPEIPWFRRAIVINWMSQICAGFSCKREAFALAVNYLDRYLTLTQNVPISQLQLIAAGALSLSNKAEGQVFTLHALANEMEEFGVPDITDMEWEILTKLGWKLNPPTSNMWANRIALQWDMYLDLQEDLPELLQENLGCIKFKTLDTESYYNYRALMQYIDFALMDVHTLQYHCRELAASFIYILLNAKLCLHEPHKIVEEFPKTSQYLLKHTEFNLFYCDFLKRSFGFALQDLLPTIQFCATFFFLPLDNSLPLAIQDDEEAQENLDYAEFCAFQTCNQNYLPCLMRRNRQFD